MISSAEDAKRALMNWEHEKTPLLVSMSSRGISLAAQVSVKKLDKESLELSGPSCNLALTVSLDEARLTRLRAVTEGAAVSINVRGVELMLAEVRG